MTELLIKKKIGFGLNKYPWLRTLATIRGLPELQTLSVVHLEDDLPL